MTTLGLHYFPDDTHYRASDLNAWLPELQALGVRWLTVIGSPARAVPEPFIAGLKAAGIEPILHLPARLPRSADLAGLAALFATYARWGVRYVSVFAEPNTRAAWPAAEWGRTGLVERFLDGMLPVWDAQRAAGLEPVFPALRAGGDYWDTAFLEAALAGLQRRGRADLLQAFTFAVNLWTYNRPVAWGAGGLKAWPQVRPYLTPPGVQDQRGFHLFDWHNEIILARAGQARPLLCLAGGPRLGDRTDPAFPAVDAARHASCIDEIATMARETRLPANLLNVNFWLLAAPEAGPFAAEAWYRGDGATLPAVDVLKRAAALAQTPSKTRVGAKAAGPKPLRHYLLLPTFEWGLSEWHWSAALDFVRVHRPACGFSADEAAQAEHVTILGNEQGVNRDVEAALRRAGCVVERILPPAP
mgnify:CR=1 FL=1